MIRVNLLEGTTEHRVSAQKTKVAAKRGQQIFMLAAALFLFGVAFAVDHFMTHSAFNAAKKEFDHEQEENKKLEADLARKTQLEEELKQVDERIKIIKQLRAEQKGPVAMLSAINERMPGGQADFRLSSIVQKGSHLQIVGSSLNQQVISDFARQLEFSNGLFTSVLPSIEGKDVKAEDVSDKKASDDAPIRVFSFKIDCDYNKPRAEGDAKSTASQAK
jgi:Tfp pilus assembly protein PilN